MKLIVTHADSITSLHSYKKGGLYDNPSLNMDLKSCKRADTLLACYSIFNYRGKEPYQYEKFLDLYDFYISTVEKNGEHAQIIRSYSDIERIYSSGKTPVMMTMEDMGPLTGDLSQVIDMYEKGVRMASFTWNYENSFGSPCSHESSVNEKGLTKKGKEAVALLNELGVVIDVSHLSDGGIDDLLSLSRQPIIASHSNARSVTNHPRNCTDGQIKGISDKGGFLGINFCASFLSDDEQASVENMIKHVNHLVRIGGIECVSIGSDFDGIDDTTLEIKKIDQMDKLYWGLHKEGYSDDAIEKIFYKNAIRAFRNILKK